MKKRLLKKLLKSVYFKSNVIGHSTDAKLIASLNKSERRALMNRSESVLSRIIEKHNVLESSRKEADGQELNRFADLFTEAMSIKNLTKIE